MKNKYLKLNEIKMCDIPCNNYLPFYNYSNTVNDDIDSNTYIIPVLIYPQVPALALAPAPAQPKSQPQP